MELMITEKPSVGRAIAAVVGAKEHKDDYMEGNGMLSAGALGIWLSWHCRRPITPTTFAGAIKTCRFCQKHGSIRSRKRRRSSLIFSAS